MKILESVSIKNWLSQLIDLGDWFVKGTLQIKQMITSNYGECYKEKLQTWLF